MLKIIVLGKHEHNWICEDKEIDWCTECQEERLHAEFCELCEDCCMHGDIPECGFCIDCGKRLD
jgi:hypothetical protein